MKTEYRRDLNHNFIILSGDTKLDRDGYKVHMIEENHIPGFLRCHVEMLNDSPMFCYEITSRQALSTLLEFREVGQSLLETILRSLRDAFSAMEDYLLPGNGLLLDPEYIYIDADLKAACFCYYPGNDEDLTLQGQRFGEQILPKLSHGDRRAVVMGYAFYQNCAEGRLSVDMLDEMLGNMPVKAEGEDFVSGENKCFGNENDSCNTSGICVRENDFSGISAEFFDADKKEEKKKGWLTGLRFGRHKKNREKKEDRTGAEESAAAEAYAGDVFLTEGPQWNASHVLVEAHAVHDDGATVLLASDQDAGKNMHHRAWLMGEAIGDGTDYRGDGETITARRQIFLDKDKYVIGKKRGSADIILDSPAVSRVHAILSYSTDSYYLRDLNSKNGTKVNDEWVRGDSPVRLKNGDRILFADVLVQYIMV